MRKAQMKVQIASLESRVQNHQETLRNLFRLLLLTRDRVELLEEVEAELMKITENLK